MHASKYSFSALLGKNVWKNVTKLSAPIFSVFKSQLKSTTDRYPRYYLYLNSQLVFFQVNPYSRVADFVSNDVKYCMHYISPSDLYFFQNGSICIESSFCNM